MKNTLSLKVEKRDVLGKKVKKLRREGLIPANIYGRKVKSEAVSVQKSDFDKVFKEKTLKKYPHLAGHRDKFKRMVMSPDFMDMTEQQIIDEYFPAPKKEDSPETGSKGGAKGDEVVDFSKMTTEQHEKVLKDPVLRAKYYKWQDEQGS